MIKLQCFTRLTLDLNKNVFYQQFQFSILFTEELKHINWETNVVYSTIIVIERNFKLNYCGIKSQIKFRTLLVENPAKQA